MRIPTFAAVLLIAAVMVLVAPGPATAEPTVHSGLSLPPPTGPLHTARAVRHLVDESRPDPWVPTERRQLMLSVWYPARHDDGPTAPYLSPAESRLFMSRLTAPGVPPEILSTVATHSTVDTPAKPRPGGWPVVVLSPGFSFPRATLTGLAEDLASRGYVVVGVDHTYEAFGVTLPDGRVTGCVACEVPGLSGERVAGGRARDVSFVLDRLPSLGVPVDPHRIAMVGHSMGGAAALATMLADPRVDVGVNLDGTFHPALPPSGMPRPFLMMGNEEHGQPGAEPTRTWDTTWANLSGWKRWLSVTGTTHSSFTDLAVLADQLGLPIQELSGERATEITRTYVAAVLDRHLRRIPQPLLNGGSHRYPEVIFQP
ncbi:esterase [Virgisporangium aliadipatigenens]|uniref:Esterase n=1 Tax=Virgisporangium aliadipatigenens TaxID=741659 RepID=A0A8J3YT23_9ACTN|nr:alpha/beta hydrolase [Virgisporangium aliadipatigenens]GIJ49311.1 esterase [Virgisporangium aliadipatigenens]